MPRRRDAKTKARQAEGKGSAAGTALSDRPPAGVAKLLSRAFFLSVVLDEVEKRRGDT